MSASRTGIYRAKRHIYAYILIAVLAVLNIPILLDLGKDWARDGNYSHGFLIIPIAIYLFYRRREDLVFPSKHARLGMALFLAGSIGLIFGVAASEFFTTRISLIAMLTGFSLYYLGTSNFKKVWFPFFFMLFMIPIPSVIYYSLTLPMQLFATSVTTDILHIIGVPSQGQGNIIYLPAYTLEVTEACSGLRSLVTLLALGALFAHLTMTGNVRPIILFLAAIPIAIAVNILRLLVTAIGAYAISSRVADSFLHELSGIMVFVVALVLIVIVAGLLKWKRKPL